MKDGPLSFEEFGTLWRPYENRVRGGVAVAVSGGPDSMALAWLLSQCAQVTAITVDHGLRPDSAQEAQETGQWLSALDIEHHILTRAAGDVSDSRVQEAARHDRYRMMAEFCHERGIQTLCVAHHMEDQAETFLFRLAKGSGLDGLSAMQDVQDMEGLVLLRPLLSVSKDRLVATCKVNNIPFVSDPSNANDKFARVRLRQSMDVLAAEGLTPKRLSVTASRLSRAREALDFYARQFFGEPINKIETNRIYFCADGFNALPEDISLRVLALAWRHLLAEDYGYGPRMEKLEDLHNRVRHESGFKGATLSGCIIRRDDTKKVIIVELE